MGLCVALISHADNQPNMLSVWSTDGTKVSYTLSDQPRVTFSKDELIISSNMTDVRYPITKMARITFENTTGIESVNSDSRSSAPFDFTGDFLMFYSEDNRIPVAIYSAEGKTIMTTIIEPQSNLAYSLRALSPGIYFIRIAKTTYKIAVK